MTAAPAEGEAPGPALPPLDDSNELTAELLKECLGTEPPPRLVGGGNLLRLLVVIVDNVAEGASPRPHLGFLGFTGDFPVVERQGLLIMDPSGYSRYDRIARYFSTADVESCASAYRRLEPLIDEAYRDLGYPDRKFVDTLRKAMGKVIEVPIPEGEVLLIAGVGIYHFEDPDMEALSDIEKQIIRMGPDNGKTVQRALLDFAAAIGRP